MATRLVLLARVAVGNLLSSFLNVFVGAVLAFAAALLLIGASLFSTLDQSLSKSIVGSVTGHYQVYAARSKTSLEVYGRMDGTDSTLAPLDGFPALKARLLALPDVARVVPMGSCTAQISAGNTVDLTLERLRDLYRDRPDAQEERRKQADSVKAHVRNMVAVLSRDAERASELVKTDTVDQEVRAALRVAAGDAFWQTFDDDPLGHLELLENKVAPEVGDADLLFIRVIGTDLDAYQATFDRMVIVEGTQVPSGHRGILLPRLFVEDTLKLRNARRLDRIRDGRSVGRRISDDAELKRWVRENQSQTREVLLQLDGLATAEATSRLQRLFGSTEPSLEALLAQFFATDDANFDARYRFFYEQLAPLLSLYRSKVGDTLTLRSFGRSGSIETSAVKLYGIFELKGLEKSPLAGASGLVDLVTFRELYGYLTAERKAELDALRAGTQLKQVTRESAEAELFGGGDALVDEARPAQLAEATTTRRATRRLETFPTSELDEGVVLHAAVMLKDDSKAAFARAGADIERLLSAERPPPDDAALAAAEQLLGTGRLPLTVALPLRQALAQERARAKDPAARSAQPLRQLEEALRLARRNLPQDDARVLDALLTASKPKAWVVDWVTAAGFLGQFIGFFRLLLLAVVLAFGFIAVVVVTIGVTVATIQRTTTFGTMRAIGAQRETVMAMVLAETLMLALVFGAVGVALGSAAVSWMHSAGIPAFRDELYFFFSGPVLRPVVTPGAVALSLFATLLVSLIAVVFPVFLVTRISPLAAMQASE